MSADLVYTQNRSYYMPDVEITRDLAEYIYVPLRGYGYCLAVFDIRDNCIGWIRTETIGHVSAGAWITATKWKDGGY